VPVHLVISKKIRVKCLDGGYFERFTAGKETGHEVMSHFSIILQVHKPKNFLDLTVKKMASMFNYRGCL